MTISADAFQFLRRFVFERSAIQLDEGKEYLVETRLGPIARAEGLADVDALVAALRSTPRSPLATAVIDAMTTNETSFFRDIRPFDALRTEILPDVIARRQSTRSLTIWSAASSTGQEAYSIAIVIREHFPELANWNVKILGTDLSTEVVAKAKSAQYTQLEVGRGLPTPLMLKYFAREGRFFTVAPAVRSLVEFRTMNLCDPLTSIGRPDIVFLRNVLIYFDLPTRERILQRTCTQMASDGWLLLGAGETILNMDVPLVRQEIGGTSCLRPTAAGSAQTAPKGPDERLRAA